jgi:hypothetical protein
MTGDIRIDALLFDGFGLATGLPSGMPLTVSYRFMENLIAPEGQSPSSSTVHGFMPMTAAQREAVRSLLENQFAAVGVRFSEVAANEPAMLRFGLSSGINGEGDDAFEAGYATYSGPGGLEPLVMINYLQNVFQDDPAGLAFQDTILHEIGHALGLKHPGDYHDYDEGPFLPQELDHTGNTIMSYNYEEGTWADNEFKLFDLLALQYLYGEDANQIDSPVVRSLDASDYYMVGSARDDILYFAPGPRQEYARSVNTSWGDDQLHVDVSAMEPWELIIFSGGEGIDTLNLNRASSMARDLAPHDDSVDFYLADGHEQRRFSLDAVERVVFTDHAVALDTEQGAGQAYRIYTAAFGREPDQPGLGYWINAMDQGASLIEVAASFLGSDEFTERYGANVDNTGYIDAVYTNVLARQPDAEGYTYWLNEMENGASRQQLLASFSESPENQANVAELIGEGIIYDPWIA